MGKLEIVIRSMAETSCPPYMEDNTSFYVIVLNCDWTWFDSFPCTGVGPGGGGVYGSLDVPEGVYVVYAVGWPPLVWTDIDWVEVGTGETVGVNLVPEPPEQAASRLQAMLTAALLEKALPAAEEIEMSRFEDRRHAVQRAHVAVADLQRFLPPCRALENLVPAVQEAGAPADLVKILTDLKRLAGGAS